MISWLQNFLRDKRGNVATLFALAIIPMVGATGMAIDYARVAAVRIKLADALDAGVLAVGTQPKMTDAKATAMVDGWLAVHMGIDPYQLDSVTQDGDAVLGKAHAVVPMTLSQVLGVKQMTVTATSQIMRTLGKVEIALVLDNTGSMAGTKIATLIKAANQLVDSLSVAADNPNNLRIGLVPFSQTVNVGATYQSADWIDAAGNSASAKSLFLGQKVNRFDLFKKLGTKWSGCVETRAAPYELTESYDKTKSDTLYVPYFAPDEPGGKNDWNPPYNNSYLDDSSTATIKAALGNINIPNADLWKYQQGDVTKYNAGNPKTGDTGFGSYQYGPNSGCDIAPLQRLTSDTKAVKKAINAMIAQGNTDIPIGLEWGWNVLSPKGPFKDGKDYNDGEWQKVIVLMTDGNNENNEGNAKDESYYAGAGYIWQGRMGATSADKPKRTQLRDDALATLCKNVKAAGKASPSDPSPDNVTIYTIRVEVKNGSSSVLKNCASDPDKFFDVQNVNQLVSVFQEIGGSIQKLRIAM
ncbi:MAG TPA: TadE/TadG family type IV pilus assembly protein [Bauldia sp.]|nr:TadE/TadG family type IV pilus assembly protein [Bauldia sp.]